MIEWVLILTISSTGGGGHGWPSIAVHSVPGFVSRDECLKAGTFWRGSVKIIGVPIATCIQRTVTVAASPK